MDIAKITGSILLLSLLLAACGGDDDDSDDDIGSAPIVTPPGIGSHVVLGFNDLGMHCADLDYSNFVILPPFNVVHSQVIERGEAPRILSISEASVNYQAQTDGSGSITSTSQNQANITKSNFWDTNPLTGNSYVFDLFGLAPQPDEGLAFGQTMPGILNPYNANDPQPFNHYDPTKGWFAADGIPILPIDDSGQLQAYPLMRVQASDTAGALLASVDVVLPVASEADCQNCHEAGEIGAIRSGIVFEIPDDVNDPNSVLQAAKENILLLHDDRHGTNLHGQRPVLCADCHYSAALDLDETGPQGVQLTLDMMSQVMHGHHGQLTDTGGALLFPPDGTLEETCYQCHPGKITQCLRGAMGGAGIICQDCHGGMLAVGGVNNLPPGTDLAGTNDGTTPRQPWIDEPRCESCHTGDALSHLGTSIRLSQTWDDGDPSAAPRTAINKRFAENSGELYRNSLGHGDVACEGCHGSTHAIWPNAQVSSNDNLAATQLQGHNGTLTECGTCHTSLPLTLNGPHGMHNVNDSRWSNNHEDFYERNESACRACHGTNLEGTVLSTTAADRDLGGRFLPKGTSVSCTLCHGKPD